MSRPTTTTVLSAAASIAASAVLVRTLANDLVPDGLKVYLVTSLSAFFARFSSRLTVVIDELDGFVSNKMYKAAELYLGTKVSPTTRRLRVGMLDDSNSPQVTMERGEEIVDVYQSIQFAWRLVLQPQIGPSHQYHNQRFRFDSEPPPDTQSFELSFHKKHKDACLKSYLPYVLERSKAIREEIRTLKLFTNEGMSWMAASLHHPATFATLALDEGLKKELMEDLERFVKRKEYYRRIGKAWKRGYLLYGPPGTGKSTLIAAMANFLRFDVYDLELSEVRCNSELRSLMVGTGNRSILVVEDIDCSMEMQQHRGAAKEGSKASSEDDPVFGSANLQLLVGRTNHQEPFQSLQVTLSGLLNFVDGLWSSCADERIIVFTTNYKDRLDPALLRPGRMDMHIHMSYCTTSGFRILAANYHSVNDHPLFWEIETLMREVEATPAEVAEELMRSEDADTAFQGLIKLLHTKERKEATICNAGVEDVEDGRSGAKED